MSKSLESLFEEPTSSILVTTQHKALTQLWTAHVNNFRWMVKGI